MDEADATLVRRALAGEPSAFDELVRRHRPGLVRFALCMIGDADEAESLAQEALTRAYARLADFQADLSFGPWVRGIALNLCRNHLRDRVRHAKNVEPDQLAETAGREGRRQGVLSAILRREVNERTLLAIAGLPEPLREAFVLHYVEEMDYAAISRITGLAPGTLRVRAHRARTLLQQTLGSVVDTWLRQASPDEPSS
jgi:RNA polymerase sigma-70 factor (ECF subfamily)